MAQQIRLSRPRYGPDQADIRRQVSPFLVRHGPLLTTIAVFIVIYIVGGQLYPATVHLRPPFDPAGDRIKGRYSSQPGSPAAPV